MFVSARMIVSQYKRSRGCLDPAPPFDGVSDYILQKLSACTLLPGYSWDRLLLALLTILVSEPSAVLFALPAARLLITLVTIRITLGFQQFSRCLPVDHSAGAPLSRLMTTLTNSNQFRHGTLSSFASFGRRTGSRLSMNRDGKREHLPSREAATSC